MSDASPPTMWVVSYPATYIDQLRVFSAEPEARECARFAARIYGEASIYRNDGRSEHVATLTRAQVHAEDEADGARWVAMRREGRAA